MLATRRTPGAGMTAGNDGSPPAERLAVVAHALRNPLAAVLYALEAMTDRGDDPASRQARAIAKRQVRRAAQLVNDLFDACAGTRGKLTVRREVVDIAGVAAGAVDAAARLFAGSEHRLTVTLPPQPLAVFADPLRLEQVLANLLTNATKFTDPGGDIHLSVGTHAARVILRTRSGSPRSATGLGAAPSSSSIRPPAAVAASPQRTRPAHLPPPGGSHDRLHPREDRRERGPAGPPSRRGCSGVRDTGAETDRPHGEHPRRRRGRPEPVAGGHARPPRPVQEAPLAGVGGHVLPRSTCCSTSTPASRPSWPT